MFLFVFNEKSSEPLRQGDRAGIYTGLNNLLGAVTQQ